MHQIVKRPSSKELSEELSEKLNEEPCVELNHPVKHQTKKSANHPEKRPLSDQSVSKKQTGVICTNK